MRPVVTLLRSCGYANVREKWNSKFQEFKKRRRVVLFFIFFVYVNDGG